MNKTKTIILVIFAFILSIGLVYFTSKKEQSFEAKEVYRVYMDGKSIGLVSSKEELESIIDKEEQSIKAKYNVSKVYSPTGLTIQKETTYSEKTQSANALYEKIKDTDDFNIEGCTFTITREEEVGDENAEEDSDKKIEKTIQKIYALNCEMFDDAVENTLISFVDKESVEAWREERQQEITSTGKTIKGISIKETTTIKEGLIPVNEKIYTNIKDLSKYFMFGNQETQKIYSVKEGDTVESIANANNLNVIEFLIANQDITNENALLYVDQQVVVSLIDPIITIVESTYEVERQTDKYQTEIIYDNSMYVGYTEVEQQGKDGEVLVSKDVVRENGQITKANITGKEIITPSINRVVRTGSKTVISIGSTEFWAWPTKTPYIITSTFSPRWGKHHDAIDISGTGRGSPIYAANDGTVIVAGWKGSYGLCVEINHNNGFITQYAHLDKIYVKVGQGVQMKQVIGTMGNTGFSTGTHLHYGVKYNGVWIDPFRLYR